ncbi:MAG: glycosyltransferase [Candidatus Uhrbacteria bacterium]|nr:glycosyltransferase [Candidatus Uhrbacteria bacterium]
MKTVLILGDYQADYGFHGLITGLYELSGIDVYEYPHLQSLRGGSDIGYDLPGNPGGGNTGCPSYLSPAPLPAPLHSKEEIFDIFPNFDLVVMGIRDYSRRSIAELCRAKGVGTNEVPLVIYDADDADFIDRDLINRYTPFVFFKRELTNQYSLAAYTGGYGVPIFPLPFSAFTRSFPKPEGPDREKRFDIFLSLGRTWPSRDVLLGTFLDAVGRDRICSPGRAWIATNGNSPMKQEHPYGYLLRDLLPWSEYMMAQSQSRITASIRGFGRDALHAWEAFLSGPLVLYCPPGLHIPHPFKNWTHCIHFNEDCGEIPSLLRRLLEEPALREAVATQGQQHCLDHHSTVARADYLISICSKLRTGEKFDMEEFGL